MQIGGCGEVGGHGGVGDGGLLAGGADAFGEVAVELSEAHFAAVRGTEYPSVWLDEAGGFFDEGGEVALDAPGGAFFAASFAEADAREGGGIEDDAVEGATFAREGIEPFHGVAADEIL